MTKSDTAAGNANGEVAAAFTTEIPEAAAAAGETMLSEAGAGNKPAAAASGIEPAKPRPMPLGWIESRPEPVVISSGIERVEEDYIEYLRAHPRRRPTPLTEEDLEWLFPWMPESIRKTNAHINETIDLYEDILRQYDEKGYALVRVEHLDNGRKRLFQLPVEESTAL